MTRYISIASFEVFGTCLTSILMAVVLLFRILILLVNIRLIRALITIHMLCVGSGEKEGIFVRQLSHKTRQLRYVQISHDCASTNGLLCQLQ